MTEPLTPDAVRALIARLEQRGAPPLIARIGGQGPIQEQPDRGLFREAAAALSAYLPREDADLDAIESRAAWAGSYSTDGVQAAAERFRIAREDVPALLARVRTAEAGRDIQSKRREHWESECNSLWRWIESLGTLAMGAGFTGVGLGWQRAIDQAVEAAALASRAAETPPVHCPSCDGYQTAVMNDGRRSVGVCEGVASRTIEMAEEWGVKLREGYIAHPFHSREEAEWLVSRKGGEIHVRRVVAPTAWEPVPPTPEEPATARECGNDSHHGYGTGYCGDCTKEAGK